MGKSAGEADLVEEGLGRVGEFSFGHVRFDGT